ncbi:glycine cleavage system protein T, partial [Acinetobacter baumannii]
MGLRTPLYDEHLALNARMVDFGGWDMPVQYASVLDEHHAVRRSQGMF